MTWIPPFRAKGEPVLFTMVTTKALLPTRGAAVPVNKVPAAVFVAATAPLPV
jgi:hypothetical protein